MDATARMFASRAAKLPIHTPRNAKQGKKETAPEDKRGAKPSEPVAKTTAGREEKPAQKRRTVITQFILMGNLTGSVAYWERRKLGKPSTHD